jgi:hypothetical protein
MEFPIQEWMTRLGFFVTPLTRAENGCMDQEQIKQAAESMAAIRAEIDAGRLDATRTEDAYIQGALHALRFVQEG